MKNFKLKNNVQRLRLYISPFFLSRFYLQRSVQQAVKKYHFKGKILDVGCGQRPYKKYFTYTTTYFGIDFKNYSINKDFFSTKPDIFFPKTYKKNLRLPFKSNSFDHCIAIQVLEHHRKPSLMISEMIRVTKHKGYILITVPFLAEIHETPNDFQRYTIYGLQQLLKGKGCMIKEIKETGYFFSTISLLTNSFLASLSSKNAVYFLLTVFFFPLFLLFSYIALILDKVITTKQFATNYTVIAEKGTYGKSR